MREFRHPTVAPWGAEIIPLAWSHENEPRGVGFVAYDATPPEVVETDPIPLGNLLDLEEISIAWDSASSFQDHLMRIKADGTDLPVTVNGGQVTAEASGLEPGIHSVSMQAVDAAGNSARHDLEFTLAELSDSPGAATLREQTVPVNPDGSTSTTTVIFESPIVDIEGFTEELNASTWVGYGDVLRPFSLGETEVTFTNDSGSDTVTVVISDAQAAYSLAAIAQSDEPLIAEIASQEVALPDVVVDVPPDFRTSDATATLRQASAALGPGRSNTKYLMGNSMPTGVPLPLRGFAQSTQVLVSEADGGVAVSGVEGRMFVRLEVLPEDGIDRQVLWNPVRPEAPEPFMEQPEIACEGEEGDESCLTPGPRGGPYLARTHSHFTFGKDAGVEFYATQWTLRDQQTEPYLAWHQLSSFVQTMDCVDGRRTVPRLKQFSTEVSQVLLNTDGMSPWLLEYESVVPDEDGNSGDSRVRRNTIMDWNAHSIYNEGVGVTKSADVTQSSGSVGAEVVWKWPDLEGLENTTEHLMLGGGWNVREGRSGETIQLESVHEWEVRLAYEGC